MEVSLIYKDKQLQRVIFTNWKDSLNRQGRIELDILKHIGWATFDSSLETVIMSRDMGFTFSNKDEAAIKRVLSRYCIEWKEENVNVAD